MPGMTHESFHRLWTEETEGSDFVVVNKPPKPSMMAQNHIFPTTVPDWNNLEVLHRNTLPPRASFDLYNCESDAIARDTSKSKSVSLSGRWKFNLANSPWDAPSTFHEKSYNVSSWGEIDVPAQLILNRYTNVIYPFPVDPPNVPFDDNETGTYRRNFTIPGPFKNHQLRLRFEGVDSSFHVWVNGKEVGYSQGSRNPSEFDVTSYVDIDGENSLAVQVYQFCDGSYIEDQDQWWLSGIFRDVNLLAFPRVHFQDFHVQTTLDTAYQDATLSVDVDLNTSSEVEFKLLDAAGKQIAATLLPATPSTTWKAKVSNPNKWTAETPYLYTLVLSTSDCTTSQRVGFRQAELLEDGVFTVNGKPVKFRGVNRHEHHPDGGRTVPYEFLRNDLLLMKTHNINAIRTSHQPNDIRLYDLADELGLWIMDECDLECHGFGTVEESSIPPEYRHLPDIDKEPLRTRNPARFTSDNPVWEEAYVDRARQAVYRDKNHPCVIMWSLGNEAFYGRNHQKMYDFIKAYDPTRLVHYEQDYSAKTVDIFSRMYASVDQVIEFAKEENWTKPLVLCEFVHAMGNSPGNIREYVEAFYEYPRLMGGFVWEWANHGLRTKTKEGVEYFGYGGDFDDEPNDANFVMDGLIRSDHTPGPGLLEWAKAIEPVQVVEGTRERVKIISRYDHTSLDDLMCQWTLIGDQLKTGGGELVLPKGIRPGQSVELDIPAMEVPAGEAYLQLSFKLREDTSWAKAGHEVAWGQIQLNSPTKLTVLKSIKSSPKVEQINRHLLEITSPGSKWQFNVVHGELISWVKSGIEMIKLPPGLDFYRPLTDNDRPKFGASWTEAYLHQTRSHCRSLSWTRNEDNLVIVVNHRIAPPVLEWSVDCVTTYTFTDQWLSIKVKGTPQGFNLPPTFARIGLTMSLNDIERVDWYGRGPGESYSDKKLSQKFGNFSATPDELFTDYEFPQECGNRTDVRWVSFAGKASLKASFGDLEGASFSALHYATKDIDECKHPYELHKLKKEETIVRLDWAHHGLGTGSCGPATLPEYQLKSEPFEFEVLLE